MRGLATGIVVLFGFMAAGPTAVEAGGIPAKTLKELKAAAVYIKVEFVPAGGTGKNIPVTGSGFLIQEVNGIGYLATNNHVVTPLVGETPAGNPKVVFFSGTPAEKIVEAHIVARDPVRDLAILKITAFKDLPKPIPMNLDNEVNETMPVFALGFPFGGDLALGKANPAITITKGTVSSLRDDDRGQVKLVQIDAEINPGNSGGPVVDEKGNLVGVAVSKLMKARTVGFAIPIKALDDMLKGKVSTMVFDTLWVVKGQAEISVEAGLVDPFGKLKDAAVHFRVVDDLKDLPRADKDGVFPPLPDAQSIWLKMNAGRGQGRISIQGTGADKVTLAYQASYVNAAGKKILSPISIVKIDFTQAVYSDRLTKADPLDQKGKPFKVFSHPMKAGKHYVIEMRADPKDLDPKIMVLDPSGKTLAEDDGVGGLFDALLVFSPTRDEDYQIIASADKGSGPYSLRIREDTGQALGPKTLSLPGNLAAGDSLDPSQTIPNKSFNFMLKKGKTYTIDVKSKDFDPFLRLENMGRITVKNEDIGGNGHSTLIYTPLQDGIYKVVATAFDSKLGRFDMTVREAPAPKPLEVGPDGIKLAGILNNFDPLDIVNGKVGKNRCKVYTMKLKGGQKYQIDLSSNQFDPFLRVEDHRGKELAFDDDSGGNLNARLIFTPPVDEVYRIVAAQFDNRVGNFDLHVRPVKQNK